MSGKKEKTKYDVCIIGSGITGMILGSELSKAGMNICVLESGGKTKNNRTDSLRKVQVGDLPIKLNSRERVFGGSSKTWGALSSPLDSIDYAQRAFVLNSGWPIDEREIEMYLKKASEYFFPHPTLFEDFFSLRSEERFLPQWEKLEEKVFLAEKNPTDFGKELKHIYERENCTVIENATAISFETKDNCVEKVNYVSTAGVESSVQAKVFILATGAIENVRILLNSHTEDGTTLGNNYDQIGRYFMNHPKGYSGIINLTKPIEQSSFYFWKDYNEKFKGYAGLRLKESEQLTLEVLNSYIRLEPLFPWTDDPSASLISSFKIKKVLYIPRFIILLIKRIFAGIHPKVRKMRIKAFAEMEPRYENRIVLSEEKDFLGIPMPSVTYSMSKNDIESLVILHTTLKNEFERLNLGEVITSREEIIANVYEDASHHLGGTRMGSDKKTSVVDKNLKLHDVRNLYVTGGSVFPTAGCVNPTLMMAGLTLRLAEHLKAVHTPKQTKQSG